MNNVLKMFTMLASEKRDLWNGIYFGLVPLFYALTFVHILIATLILTHVRCCCVKRPDKPRKPRKWWGCTCVGYLDFTGLDCKYYLKNYSFLFVCVFFLIFILIYQRPCSLSLCLDKISEGKSLVETASENIAQNLKGVFFPDDEFSHNNEDSVSGCEKGENYSVYDTCRHLPPQSEKYCNQRVGADLGCFCFARTVYPFAGWLSPPSNSTENYDLYYHQIPAHSEKYLGELFSQLGNMDFLARDVWMTVTIGGNFTSKDADTMMLVYPERFVGKYFVKKNELFAEGCMAVDTNITVFNISEEIHTECLLGYNPVEDIAYLSTYTNKKYDVVIFSDISRYESSEQRYYQETMLAHTLRKLYHFNDLVSVVRFADGVIEEYDEFVHLSEENIDQIFEFATNNTNQKGIRSIRKVFGAGTSFHQSKGINYDTLFLLFIHGDFDDKLPPANLQIHYIPLIFKFNHSQRHEMCKKKDNFPFARDPFNCSEIFSNSTLTREKIRLRKFVNTTYSMYESGNNNTRKELKDHLMTVLTYPHQYEIEKSQVLSLSTLVSYSIQHQMNYNVSILVGANIDFENTNLVFCKSMQELYQTNQEYFPMPVYFTQQLFIIVIITGYLMYTYLFQCIIWNNKNEAKLKMLFESVFDLNHIWLVIIFTVLIVCNTIFLIDYTRDALIISGGILIGYWILLFVGVFLMKAKKFQTRGRPKKDTMLKGITLKVEEIVFDDFIKGKFENISIESGKLTAIMGHSGAGKTTFLRILQGLYKAKKQNVEISRTENGQIVHEKVENMKELGSFVGFVPQEEILPKRLTFFEILYNQVKQKYASYGREIIDYFVEQLFKQGSLEDLYNKFPHELSGGQRKRLSVLKELVSSNPILILDEPTSGLDSIATEDLIDNLKELAESGLAVCLVIHQPSTKVINKFDRLYIFLKKEETVQCAEVDMSKKDITSDDIDDFLKSSDDFLVENPVEEKPENVRKGDVISGLFEKHTSKSTSFFRKFLYLIPRFALEELRDVQGIATDFLVIFSCAISLIVIFSPLYSFTGKSPTEIDQCLSARCGDAKRQPLDCSSHEILYECAFPTKFPLFLQLFCLMFCMGLIALITSLRIFGEEKLNMKREFRSGVNYFQWYLVKLVMHIPRVLLSVHLFLLLTYSSTCLVAPYYYYYVVCLLVYFWITGVGIVASLFFPKKENATESVLLGIVVVMSAVLFSGVITTKSQVDPSRSNSVLFSLMLFLRNFSFSFFGNEALFVQELLKYADKYSITVSQLIEEYRSFSRKLLTKSRTFRGERERLLINEEVGDQKDIVGGYEPKKMYFLEPARRRSINILEHVVEEDEEEEEIFVENRENTEVDEQADTVEIELE